MTKSELRKAFLAKRSSLSSADQALKSRQICDLLFGNIDLSSVYYLHCFISIDRFNEIDTHLIFERLWRAHPHINVLAPRIELKTGELQNLRYTPDTELIEAAWSIREPAYHDRVETSKIDTVLVPLLCFDRRGHRVGYGKGYYDRFLANCRSDCLKIGLSYFPPVETIDDVGRHDVMLDRCITPHEVFTFARSS